MDESIIEQIKEELLEAAIEAAKVAAREVAEDAAEKAAEDAIDDAVNTLRDEIETAITDALDDTSDDPKRRRLWVMSQDGRWLTQMRSMRLVHFFANRNIADGWYLQLQGYDGISDQCTGAYATEEEAKSELARVADALEAFIAGTGPAVYRIK